MTWSDAVTAIGAVIGGLAWLALLLVILLGTVDVLRWFIRLTGPL